MELSCIYATLSFKFLPVPEDTAENINCRNRFLNPKMHPLVSSHIGSSKRFISSLYRRAIVPGSHTWRFTAFLLAFFAVNGFILAYREVLCDEGRPLLLVPSAPAPPVEYLVQTIENMTTYLTDYPVSDNSKFAEMGHRTEILYNMLTTRETLAHTMSSQQKERFDNSTEKFMYSLFPFLSHDGSPLRTYLDTYPAPSNSRGIVIPVNTKMFRFACHLVSTLRHIVYSTLPIEIFYIGDQDLPLEYREFIVSLGDGIETIDILPLVDDTTLDLVHGRYALKPFTILVSKFREVILLDADTIFYQPPERIFDSHRGYQKTGTLLFRDRHTKHLDYPGRDDWWSKQMKQHPRPSTNLEYSAWTDGTSNEEGESGVVVVDKGRLGVLMGLLHICWQNTESVRKEWTYKMAWGEKESYWWGFEFTGTPYTVAKHYAAVSGLAQPYPDEDSSETGICANTITHLDEEDKVLWSNGSLLKHKGLNQTEFLVPTHWMIDGVWVKGIAPDWVFCMHNGISTRLDDSEQRIIEESVQMAKEIDQKLAAQFPTILHG